jgi:hypothetical protein
MRRLFRTVPTGPPGMRHVFDDGGRKAAGYTGTTGDCVVRSIAIAHGLPYQEVYDLFNHLGTQERSSKKRRGKKSSARTGVFKNTYRRWLEANGWTFVPTMQIGTGCRVHLRDGELPMGRLIVAVSRHLVAVIDGVVHDTHDCTRAGTRCVYGFFKRTA